MMQGSDFAYDVIVIGAGVVGAAIARSLSRYDLRIAWLEAQNDVGRGASCANSAIIHSGHDPLPGTLKARLNLQGNQLWQIWSEELGIPFKKTGSLVVALEGQDSGALKGLLGRAVQNGVSGGEIWDRDRMLAYEPLLHPDCRAGLWTPGAALIDPFQAVFALAENAVNNGVVLSLNTRVTGLHRTAEGRWILNSTAGEWKCRWVINSAGLGAVDLMHSAGLHTEVQIIPRKGEYFILDPQILKTNSVLFPLPCPLGKGTMVTTTLHGNTIIGPTAAPVPDPEDNSMTPAGMQEILEHARRLIPSLEARYIIAAYAGVRATSSLPGHDFLVEHLPGYPGLINLIGIDSPGLASAPALAEETVKLIAEAGLTLNFRKEWNPRRDPPVRFKELSQSEQKLRCSQDPAWGRLVCRCEMVTEAEVLQALRGPVPARDYDGIKRRCWLGTGRCQGSFDIPRVLQIMSRELRTGITALTKKGSGSEWIYHRTRE